MKDRLDVIEDLLYRSCGPDEPGSDERNQQVMRLLLEECHFLRDELDMRVKFVHEAKKLAERQ